MFEIYGAHVGRQSVPTVMSAPRIGYQQVNGAGSVWGLAGSASIKHRTLTLTVVNPETAAAPVAAGTFVHRLPPASVTRLTLT